MTQASYSFFLCSLIFLVARSSKPALDCRLDHPYVDEIQKVVRQYNRPITILELSSCCAFYSRMIAQSTDRATCVVLESKRAPFIFQLLEKQNLSNTILLTQGITWDGIKRLTECEHFDIAIINMSLWQGVITKPFITWCQNLAEHLFVEFLPTRLHSDCSSYITARGVELPSSAPDRYQKTKMMLLRGSRTTLLRPSWLKGPKKGISFSIQYDFQKKLFIKRKHTVQGDTTVTSEWQPGINLVTFKMLRGRYPSHNELKKAVLETKEIPHTDWNPHNMIVQGKKVVLIDDNDPFVSTLWPWPESLVEKFLDLQSPHEVQQLVTSLFKRKPDSEGLLL